MAGLALLGIVATATVILVSRVPPESPAVKAAVSKRYSVPDEGANHVEQGSPITYKHYPPSSGPHYGAPAQYGVQAVPVPEGAWVHNLEHGAIVLLYKCAGDCEQKAKQIRDLYERLPVGAFGSVKLVAAPYERGPTAYTLLAWGWQEDLEVFDAGRIERFYRDRVDRGPESVP